MSCSNRFQLPGSPSTCALDTFIAPLPSFILLAGPLIIIPLCYRNGSCSEEHHTAAPPRWLHVLYIVLVALTFGMTILEIARLAVERAGFGLLPIISAALLLITIALVLQLKQRTLFGSLTLFIFWTLSVIVESIKVSRLHLLNVLYPSKASKYPSSDKLLDNAVILALYAVFLCVEGFTIYVLTKRKSFPSCVTRA